MHKWASRCKPGKQPLSCRPVVYCRPQNMIAQSQSGTGKTAAFVLTMLSRVNSAEQYPQVCNRMVAALTFLWLAPAAVDGQSTSCISVAVEWITRCWPCDCAARFSNDFFHSNQQGETENNPQWDSTVFRLPCSLISDCLCTMYGPLKNGLDAWPWTWQCPGGWCCGNAYSKSTALAFTSTVITYFCTFGLFTYTVMQVFWHILYFCYYCIKSRWGQVPNVCFIRLKILAQCLVMVLHKSSTSVRTCMYYSCHRAGPYPAFWVRGVRLIPSLWMRGVRPVPSFLD